MFFIKNYIFMIYSIVNLIHSLLIIIRFEIKFSLRKKADSCEENYDINRRGYQRGLKAIFKSLLHNQFFTQRNTKDAIKDLKPEDKGLTHGPSDSRSDTPRGPSTVPRRIYTVDPQSV